MSQKMKNDKNNDSIGICKLLLSYRPIIFTVICTVIITVNLTTMFMFHACSEDKYNSWNINNDFSKSVAAVFFDSDSSGYGDGDGADADADQSISNNDDTNNINIPSIAWKPWDFSQHPFPCYPGEIEGGLQSTKPAHEGILFQRPTKVGSTTMTNVVLRLVHNRGQAEKKRQEQNNSNRNSALLQHKLPIWPHPTPRCQYRSNHGTALDLEYPQRDPHKSILFSLVRDPTKRTISAFFHFEVSVHQKVPTDEIFQTYALQNIKNHPLIHDLIFNETHYLTKFHNKYQKHHQKGKLYKNKTRRQTFVGNHPYPIPPDHYEIVNDVLQGYNFIAIMERMDESLVAMKLLFNLTLEEILYVKPSRTSGSFSNGPRTKDDFRPCVYLTPSFLTAGMKEFFSDNMEWNEYIKADELLHQAVTKSLDRTIDEVFGRRTFNKELAKFQMAQKYAQTICSKKDENEHDLVLSMCDSNGYDVVNDPNRSTTCYIWGEGCDYKCLNEKVPHPIPKEILLETN